MVPSDKKLEAALVAPDGFAVVEKPSSWGRRPAQQDQKVVLKIQAFCVFSLQPSGRSEFGVQFCKFRFALGVQMSRNDKLR